jgi:hypothetical protein
MKQQIAFSLTVLILLVLTSAGCVNSHKGSDLSKLGTSVQIVKGKTTEQELRQAFGDPSHVTTHGDGSRILNWFDARTKGYIVPTPLPGPSGDVRTATKSLSVTVRDGVVVDYTTNEGSGRAI